MRWVSIASDIKLATTAIDVPASSTTGAQRRARASEIRPPTPTPTTTGTAGPKLRCWAPARGMNSARRKSRGANTVSDSGANAPRMCSSISSFPARPIIGTANGYRGLPWSRSPRANVGSATESVRPRASNGTAGLGARTIVHPATPRPSARGTSSVTLIPTPTASAATPRTDATAALRPVVLEARASHATPATNIVSAGMST